MKPYRRAASSAGLLALAGLVATIGAGTILVSAADHLDAPSTKANHQLDITDVYAFKSTGGTTLILNVNPLTSPADSKTTRFSTNAIYQFNIDRNLNALADMAYRVKFGPAHMVDGGDVVQTYTIKRSVGASARTNDWIGTTVATGQTTTYQRPSLRIAHIAGGGKAFAGVRDDPFFFDLPGFVEFKKQLLAGSTNLGVLLGGFTGTDTFAGTNVSSIAIEVPDARLGGTGRTVGVWGTVLSKANGTYHQVERMGRPAINTVFNNTSAEKEAANRLRPSDDRAFDRDNVIATLTAIDHVLEVNGAPNYTAPQIAGLADFLTPDTLTTKLGDSAGFPNGRRLTDDVINAEFSLLTHGNVTSDGVDANDHAFRARFPYLGAPQGGRARPGPPAGPGRHRPPSHCHHMTTGMRNQMTTVTRHVAGLPRVPLAVLGLTIAVVISGQLLSRIATGPDATRTDRAPVAGGAVRAGSDGAPAAGLDPLTPVVSVLTSDDLDRIRANVTFWGDRLVRSPRDFISATRLAASEIELARATGDLGAYLGASSAVDAALRADPDYPIARGYRGVVQLALHDFTGAHRTAEAILAERPDDSTALAILGDASLELGDVTAAARAYGRLTTLDDSAAARVRASHLAFVEGRTADAVTASRAAVAAAAEEGSGGSALAWYRYQLGDTLIATGDRPGAATAYAAALAADPRSHLAHWGLARVAAADGRIDDAISQMSEAIALVPLPEFLARRADLYRLRAADGDARRESDDRRTVLAIAQLAGAASNVYDRTLALYLAGSGDDPTRALTLAQGEIAVRKDVYGYDALAWALLANDRPAEAHDAMTKALAFGTRDAKLLYHAGMIAAARGDGALARERLGDALALDPSFDPLAARLAGSTLAGLR